MKAVGHVKIHRSILGHPVFRNDGEAMAFAWMVLRAAWKPTRVRYKGRFVDLKRGQLTVSVRDMAAALDRDKAWVERLLRRLKSETMVETASKTPGETGGETAPSVITICNYDSFQGSRDKGETPAETPIETLARQKRDTEQEREESKEDNKLPSEADMARERFACPQGVGAQVWKDFLENRKRKKLANTPTAYDGVLRDIAKFTNDEWPPGRVMQVVAEKGWGGVYDPRQSQAMNGHSNGQPSQSLRGSRPNPALDLRRAAERELAAERENETRDRGLGLALPPG